MRSATAPELALLLGGLFNVHVRVWVANADGTWKNTSALSGFDFLEEVEIDVDIDQPISEAVVRFKRDIGALSLAPFREDSILNRKDDGVTYANLIDPGRDIFIETAVVAIGAAPIPSDWKNMFLGIIDSVDSASDTLEVRARDLGAYIADAWFFEKTARTWDGGIALETAIQQILDEGGMDGRVTTVTLFTPVSPSYQVTQFGYDREPVLEGVTRLAQVIGWDVRYRWDSGTSSWRFTLQDPDRTKTIPDVTIGASQYIDVETLAIDRSEVRNSVTVKWGPNTVGGRIAKLYEDGVSISRFRTRSIVIEEASDSAINTEAEADALAAAVLADLANPKAEQAIEMLYFWPVELQDLQRFSPNGVHYNVAQDLAVVRYRHVLGRNGGTEHRTIVQVRGKPAGSYLKWIGRSANPVLPTEKDPILAMKLVRRPSTNDTQVDLDVYVADSTPAPEAAIVVKATGQGVAAVVAEDGQQSAVLGSRGTMIREPRNLTLAPWQIGGAGTTTYEAAEVAPDGTLGVSKITDTFSGGFYRYQKLADGDFNGVEFTARVWLRTSIPGVTVNFGVLDQGHTAAGSVVPTYKSVVTTDAAWHLYEVTGTADHTTSSIHGYVQVIAAGSHAFVWYPHIVRGTIEPSTTDLETTDFVRFRVTKPDRQATATNIALESDTLASAPWIVGSGITPTENAATFNGVPFTLVETNNTDTLRQVVKPEVNGVHCVGIKLRHFPSVGGVGTVYLGIYEFVGGVEATIFPFLFGADGTVTAGALSGTGGEIISVENEGDGAYQVWFRTTALDSTKEYFVYGAGSATVVKYYISRYMVIAGATPFPASIVTTTERVTRTVDNPNGLVQFTATRNGRSPVSQSITIEPSGAIAVAGALITLEGEGTARGGALEGQVRALIKFDAKTQEIHLHASESEDPAGDSPENNDDSLSGIVRRVEGTIGADDNWETEWDVGTTEDFYRQINALIYAIPNPSASFSRMPPILSLEEQATDVGTGPTAPPSALIATPSVVNGTPRMSISFTIGDALAHHRIQRNGIWLKRLAPGVNSLVDDGITPDKTYVYRVQAVRNGQTSEFSDGPGGGGTGGSSGSGTLTAPSWVAGYPVGGSALLDNGNPAYVNIRVANPNALSETEVWISPGPSDTGTFAKVWTLAVGATDVTLFAASLGLVTGDERYFYLIAIRPSYTNSPESTHLPATFRPDPL